MTFELIPSIDLRDGKVVRLHQGDYARETVYEVDPVEVAAAYASAGAGWIHVVDLDAALTGEGRNRSIVTAIAGALPDVKLQTGGGVRTEVIADRLLDAGVARVVIGTAAVSDPGLVSRIAARHPGAVAVGLDHREGAVAVHGWTETSGNRVLEMAAAFESEGAAALIVTNIGHDATMLGPDLAGLIAVLQATTIDVVASGGVGALEHLETLSAVEVDGRRLAGAIVGKALYEGRFTVEEALSCIR